jgi:hypothetical protein
MLNVCALGPKATNKNRKRARKGIKEGRRERKG